MCSFCERIVIGTTDTNNNIFLRTSISEKREKFSVLTEEWYFWARKTLWIQRMITKPTIQKRFLVSAVFVIYDICAIFHIKWINKQRKAINSCQRLWNRNDTRSNLKFLTLSFLFFYVRYAIRLIKQQITKLTTDWEKKNRPDLFFNVYINCYDTQKLFKWTHILYRRQT